VINYKKLLKNKNIVQYYFNGVMVKIPAWMKV